MRRTIRPLTGLDSPFLLPVANGPAGELVHFQGANDATQIVGMDAPAAIGSILVNRSCSPAEPMRSASSRSR